MTDFKEGDKVVVTARNKGWWTEGKIYEVVCVARGLGSHPGILGVRDDSGVFTPIDSVRDFMASFPDADGWYPMPKLKAGDPIPEWLVDPKTKYRTSKGIVWGFTSIPLEAVLHGYYAHYRPAPKTEIATTPDGKEYRITHNPDGSVKAEVV